jgi:hypothetical protein
MTMTGETIKLIGTVAGTVIAFVGIYEAGKYAVSRKFFKNRNNGTGVAPQVCDQRHKEVEQRLDNGDNHFKKLDNRSKATNKEVIFTKLLVLEIVTSAQQKEAERKFKALISNENNHD